MTFEHIHDALDQVRQLRDLVIRRRIFRGYSWQARLASGGLALTGSAVLAHGGIAAENTAHLTGWGIVLLLAIAINYGAVAWRFVRDAEFRQDPSRLKPALDALPALVAGAVLTAALIFSGQFNLLFGTWMLMYGLAQTTYRHNLPRGVYWTGMVFMACGGMLLVQPLPFTSPWPMGIIFFLGEMAGGICLRQQEDELT
jgi:hypothetical protein